MVKSYKDLNVWVKAIALADFIFQATDSFPKTQLYGLSSQMQRAGVSVASNIAEGASRNSTKEFIQFLSIAAGSLAELETQALIAHKRKFMSDSDIKIFTQQSDDISKMLQGLITSLKRKI